MSMKKLIFHATLTFITIFNKAHLLLSYFELILQYRSYFCEIYFNIFSDLCLGLQNDAFYSDSFTELCAFLIAPMRAA
jgi:hypothetical protein